MKGFKTEIVAFWVVTPFEQNQDKRVKFTKKIVSDAVVVGNKTLTHSTRHFTTFILDLYFYYHSWCWLILVSWLYAYKQNSEPIQLADWNLYCVGFMVWKANRFISQEKLWLHIYRQWHLSNWNGFAGWLNSFNNLRSVCSLSIEIFSVIQKNDFGVALPCTGGSSLSNKIIWFYR